MKVAVVHFQRWGWTLLCFLLRLETWSCPRELIPFSLSSKRGFFFLVEIPVLFQYFLDVYFVWNMSNSLHL